MTRLIPLDLRLTLWSIVFLFAILLWVSDAARAQQLLSSITALDVPVDARSIGMAESFVAVPGDISAVTYNPAGLSTITGVRAYYGYRSLNWLRMSPDLDYHSAAIAFSTPLGSVGILYTRADQGEFPVMSISSPQTLGTIGSHSDMLALGFGRTIIGGLQGGATFKGFAERYTTESGDPGLFYGSFGSFMLDLGLLYTKTGVIGDERIGDSFSAGFSLQNFGTDLREQISIEHQPPPPSDFITVPRYLRFGISYGLSILPADPAALVPLHFLLTLGYRGLLNPGDDQNDRRDYWGWGMEVAAYDMFVLRMGGFIDGAGSIYGAKGVPALRFGLGLALPMARFGVSAPLVLRADYASIPLQQVGFFGPMQAKSSLPAFTLGITYEKDVF